MRKMIYERGPALYLLTIATIIAIYFGRMCAPAYNYVLKGEITQEQALELRSDILITEAERSLLRELAEMNEISARVAVVFPADTQGQSTIIDHLDVAPYTEMINNALKNIETDKLWLSVERTEPSATVLLTYLSHSNDPLSSTFVYYDFTPSENSFTKEIQMIYLIADEAHSSTTPTGFLHLTNENNTRFTMDTARKV